MSYKEFSPEEFMQDVLTQQNQQKANFEQKIERHDKLLLKYRQELYNESPPELERLFQLERIITQFIDLLNSDKYNEGYFQYDLEGTFTGFLEWKMRLSDRVISEYSALLNAIGVRSKQVSFRFTNNLPASRPSSLSKEERDVLKPIRGPYKTKKAEWLKWYSSRVWDIILTELRSRNPLNYDIIDKRVLNELRNKNIPDSSLRGWFPAGTKKDRIDEIHQQVLGSYSFN